MMFPIELPRSKRLSGMANTEEKAKRRAVTEASEMDSMFESDDEVLVSSRR